MLVAGGPRLPHLTVPSSTCTTGTGIHLPGDCYFFFEPGMPIFRGPRKSAFWAPKYRPGFVRDLKFIECVWILVFLRPGQGDFNLGKLPGKALKMAI